MYDPPLKCIVFGRPVLVFKSFLVFCGFFNRRLRRLALKLNKFPKNNLACMTRLNLKQILYYLKRRIAKYKLVVCGKMDAKSLVNMYGML